MDQILRGSVQQGHICQIMTTYMVIEEEVSNSQRVDVRRQQGEVENDGAGQT